MTDAKFGRYEVEAEIGQGAMGKVYLAFDPLTNRKVAIKALKEDIIAQDATGEYQKRFQREARAAGSLSHPNIITIFDVGENYFVMEYLEGESLLDLLADREPLSLEKTLEIVSPIADALAYAHSKGVYHRDVKPANIMVFPDGRPVITDFGLAHLESTVMTTAGQFLGSPSYMAPEQVLGNEITSKSDLYSLSVVTYEMLTGNKPFPGENVTSVIYKVVHSEPMSPHAFNPELPSEYSDIFLRALAKEPEKRFKDFAEFVAALNLEEFERLEEAGEPTIVTTGAAPSPVVDEVRGEQETADLPIPSDASDQKAAESHASITERKRPSVWSGKRNLAIGAAAAVVLAAILALSGLFGDSTVEDLLVETNPEEAEVWIDGELRGTAPFTLASIEYGTHEVRVEKEGFLTLEDDFELAAGEDFDKLLFSLQPAHVTLYLESNPENAKVTFDGEDIGETPLEDFEMEPGQHELEVSRRGYETWRSVVVAKAGESVNLVASLRPLRRAAAPATPKPQPAPEAPASEATENAEPDLPVPVPVIGSLPPAPELPEEGELIELGPDDTPPQKVSGHAPSYPKMARRLNQQGRVMLEFIVTEEGVPTDIEIIESAGSILDQAVIDAVSKWRYTPAERRGVKVKVKLRVRQTFRLGR